MKVLIDVPGLRTGEYCILQENNEASMDDFLHARVILITLLGTKMQERHSPLTYEAALERLKKEYSNATVLLTQSFQWYIENKSKILLQLDYYEYGKHLRGFNVQFVPKPNIELTRSEVEVVANAMKEYLKGLPEDIRSKFTQYAITFNGALYRQCKFWDEEESNVSKGL